jgi:release factor glutamine methyltransferase
VAEVWTPLRVLEWTARRFEEAGNRSARLDAQVLLAHVLGCDRIALYTQFDKPLGAAELSRYRELIRRRLCGEPVAYLVGEKEFWSLSLAVDSRVLIPRPDTELLVSVAVELAQKCAAPVRIADIATGSGAVAIALAREIPDAIVVAADVSADAVAVARGNAARHQVAIDIRQGDLTAPVADAAPFDLVVSNPPYICSTAIDTLAAEVRREPRLALDGGLDGLGVLRRLAQDAPRLLVRGGLLVVEHGHDQAAAVRDLLGDYQGVQTRRDLAGNPRVTWGRWGSPRAVTSPRRDER